MLLKEIKGGLLGVYIYSWNRIELQNRGALHIHLLLWIKVIEAIKNNYINNDYIWARMHPNKEVNDKVKKYQIHTAALICGHHFVQSNLNVKYISTSINGENFKYLKTKKEIEKMSENDQNIFKESTFD